MKRISLAVCFLLLILSLSGCVYIRSWVKPKLKPGTAAAAKAPVEYAGPKAKVLLGDFESKSIKASAETAAALRRMLVTALMNSKRFIVAENQGSAADLIIAASVTEFEPQASGGRAGIGGGGGVASGALGSLSGINLNKAHLGLDMRIIDSATSKVISVTHMQGEAANVSGNIKAGWGAWDLEEELSVYSNTPMETAIHACISEALKYITQNIPQSYYQYPKPEEKK
ncbi:MAG: CsgG/HfaB family protein [Candidatus Omnitrophota bacterium]